MSQNCSAEAHRIDTATVSMKYVVGGWLTLIFCVCGIITNIFTVIVLSHPRMRNSSTHVYLMALSACNIFLSIGIMINYSLKSIASYPEMLAYLHQPDQTNRKALQANAYEQFYAQVAPFTTPLMSMLLLSSTYLTVLVSGDRYFLICWPTLAAKIRTRKVSLRLVLLVLVIVNIYVFPHWFEYRTGYVKTVNESIKINSSSSNFPTATEINRNKEKRLFELTHGSIGSYPLYRKIYRLYLNIPISFFIPFTLLTICNGSMIYKLVMIRKQKKRLGRRMRADIRITTMLIVIVLMFMLCRSLNVFVNMLVQFTPCLNNNFLHRYNTWTNLLIAFNGFVNFFLFAAFGQRFREMVFAVFFRRGRYGIFTPIEGGSNHRIGTPGTLAGCDPNRRTSRQPSAIDSEIWAAIARRRSSATMAVLANPLENHSKLLKETMVHSTNLAIPNEISENSTNKFLSNETTIHNESCRSSLGNTLTVPGDISPLTKLSSPSCIKKKSEETSPSINHRVKFV